MAEVVGSALPEPRRSSRLLAKQRGGSGKSVSSEYFTKQSRTRAVSAVKTSKRRGTRARHVR